MARVRKRGIGEVPEALSRRGVELAGSDHPPLEGPDEGLGQGGRAGQRR